jgi:hypothetical protein
MGCQRTVLPLLPEFDQTAVGVEVLESDSTCTAASARCLGMESQ